MKDSSNKKRGTVKERLAAAYGKTKKYIIDNRKGLGKLLLMVVSLVALSLAALLALSALGIVYYEDGLQINMELFERFQHSWYGWIIIISVQVFITSVLCFIPGASMAFIMLLTAIYPNKLTAFLLAFTGVMLSSLIMYIIGRFGGYAVCTRLLGEEDCEKASRLLNNRGVVFFPVMMLFPLFPDDALVMIAGTLKMSLKWFIPSIVVCRSVGIATIVFGLGNMSFEKFTTVWHWAAFIIICAVGIISVFWAANKLSLYLEKKSLAAESAGKESVAQDAVNENGVTAEDTENVDVQETVN